MRKALVFDLGTSSVKASLWQEDGTKLSSVTKDYPLYSDGDKIREQNPNDWWEKIKEATKELLFPLSKEEREHISYISLSGHSLGVVPISFDGKLLTNRTPIWSDARAFCEAETFFKSVDYEEWYYKTGCGFTPCLYSVFKMMWLKKHKPEEYEKTKVYLGTKDYINYLLTGKLATDRCYAGGSGVYDITKDCYIDAYIESAKIDKSKLPKVLEPTHILGGIKEDIAKEFGLSPFCLVVCGSVDNACMCLGAGCINDGDFYSSLGSSAWIAGCSNTPALDLKKGIYTFPHPIKGKYIPACGIYSFGSSLDFSANLYYQELAKEERLKAMDKEAEASPLGANDVLFCPILAGGSPLEPSPNIKGGFYGITLATKRSEIARATLEGVCFDLKLCHTALSKKIKLGKQLVTVGGGTKSPILLTTLANILDKEIVKSQVGRDAGTLGALALAFCGQGEWKDYQIVPKLNKSEETILPNQEDVKTYQKLFENFEKLLTCSAKLEE